MIGAVVILGLVGAALAGVAGWLYLRSRLLTVGDWPLFVLRPVAVDDCVPVVMYHDVTAAQFAGDLEYLLGERYRLLRLAEFARFLNDGTKPAERCVLLTFDDGLLSTYQIAAPLLRKYGASGVCFVAPGLIREGDPRPTLEDVWAGKASPDDIPTKRNELTFWSELEAMNRGGSIDIQSHGWDHRLIYISSELMEFYDGSQRTWHYGRTVPIPSEQEEADHTWWQPRAALGRPMYRYRSRMSAARRFIESPAVRRACEQYVAAHGGPQFFTRDGSRQRLRAVYDAAVAAAGGPGRFETAEEQMAAIRESLLRSRQTLHDRLGLAGVDYLCLPYNESCALACRCAGEAGYTAVFVGRSGSPYGFIAPGHDPFQINRVTANVGTISLVPSLPGRARRSFNHMVMQFIVRGHTRRTGA